MSLAIYGHFLELKANNESDTDCHWKSERGCVMAGGLWTPFAQGGIMQRNEKAPRVVYRLKK